MTEDRRNKPRIVIIDPVGSSKYIEIDPTLNGRYAAPYSESRADKPHRDQDTQDPPTTIPQPPLKARKSYKIVLPEGFDHNDYDLFGPTDPDEGPKF